MSDYPFKDQKEEKEFFRRLAVEQGCMIPDSEESVEYKAKNCLHCREHFYLAANLMNLWGTKVNISRENGEFRVDFPNDRLPEEERQKVDEKFKKNAGDFFDMILGKDRGNNRANDSSQ